MNKFEHKDLEIQKVSLGMTDNDLKNVDIIMKYLNCENKATAVGAALSIVADLSTRMIKDKSELLLKSTDNTEIVYLPGFSYNPQ
jgi:hypothetical protein